MTTKTLRNKLAEYIHYADEKKIKAIYTMVENDIMENEDIWTKEFVADMNKRIEDFETGKEKGIDNAVLIKKLKKLPAKKL
jgi:hypothetical protein